MTTTLDQAVSQIQQELLTIRTQIASRVQMSESVQATDKLTTAQSHEYIHSTASSCINTNDFGRPTKDTPCLIDVNCLGRPKEFSGTKEDSQQWSKKMESEMMLEWAAEQPTEITTTAIDLEFLPTECERGQCKTWSSCCSRCTQHSWLSRVLKRMTSSPTRGRTRWRHGGDYRRDTIRQQEEENETFCARSFPLDGVLFWNSQRGSNAGSPTCLAARKR